MDPIEVIRLSTDDEPIIEVDKSTADIITRKDTKDIVQKWFLGTKYTPVERDAIVRIMESKGIYPEDWAHDRELKSGLYPDIRDPNFSQQLYNKQEFYEARAAAISALEGTDPCNKTIENVFEISPIQRLVSRFLNPKTPYNGLLLYHGVGVGKTCSAIRVGEEFLKAAPHSKVFIIVPQAISAGFKRTIFDSTRLKKTSDGWSSEQCTGMIYPDLALQELTKSSKAGQEFTVEAISDAVDKKIRERYLRFGYLQFANWIGRQLREIPSHLTGEERNNAINNMISRLFSDKLIIIDEAHNLRDTSGGFSMEIAGSGDDEVGADDDDDPANSADDHVGGKRLTPLLRRIVRYADGVRLLLMSATPMYNKAAEISHLLNLLIVNDTKDHSPNKIIGDIFTKDGNLKNKGDIEIKTYAQRYVSYMRGENPYTFPLRLRPSWIPKKIVWPTMQKVGNHERKIELTKEDQNILNALPIVQIEAKTDTPIFLRLKQVLKEGTEEDFKTETWVHLDVSNIVYPNGLYGHQGWDSYFNDSHGVAEGMKYRSFVWKGDEETKSIDDIFSPNNLPNFAPKMAKIVETVQKSDGINFIYSRYVKAGILPIAVALERQGWTRVFNKADSHPVFTGPKVSRQCAMCERKEDNHKGAAIGHTFVPACYVLLTGDIMLTPNFADILTYISQWTKGDKLAPYGGRVKAILGSQVTTEGLDLKCIRSVHILEPWYHLNRIEQIVGRAIRFCSHADLPMNLRNCLVYLYALTLPRIETPDLHAYRISAVKAKAIGAIQRLMKISAMDCNLNIAGLLIRDLGEGLPTRNIIDSERKPTSKYPLGDNSYSSTCDYLNECDYTCMPSVVEKETKDIKTYTYGDAQKRLLEKEQRLKEIFSKHDIAYPLEEIRKKLYGDLPWEIVSRALVHILESPSFKITRKDGIDGRLILQNGYLLFQPIGVRSKQIPLAYRYSRVYSYLPRASIVPHRGTILGEKESVVAVEDIGVKGEAVMDPLTTFQLWMKLVKGILEDFKNKKLSPKAVIDKWTPPPSKESAYQTKAWGWLLYHFRDYKDIKKIAAMFWTERAWSAGERKEVLEKIINDESQFDAELVLALKKDLFRIESIAGFKWVNPTSNLLESYCLVDGEFSTCPSSFEDLIQKKIGHAVDVKSGTGDLFGFLAPKDNTIIFKSLDKKGTKKITGAVGSACSVASAMGGHRERIRDTQNIIRKSAPELKKYLIDDTDSAEARDEKGRGERLEALEFKHIDDFSHIYVCMYMELLFRILDNDGVSNKRWFLNAVEAGRAGLKGR